MERNQQPIGVFDSGVGGLTVVKFPDNHLVYALTWFALMLLALFFAWRLWRPSADASNMPDE